MKKYFLSWGILYTILVVTISLLSIQYLGKSAANTYAERLVNRQMWDVQRQVYFDKEEVLLEVFEEDLEKGFYFIIADENGKTLAGSFEGSFSEEEVTKLVQDYKKNHDSVDPHVSFMKRTIDNTEYILGVRRYRIKSTDKNRIETIIIGLLNTDEFDNIYDTLALYLSMTMILISIAMLVLLYFASKRISKSINNIIVHAEEIKNSSNFSERMDNDESVPELMALVGAHNRLLERVESILKAQRDFGRNVSHELRTPISVINAQCQSFYENTDKDESTECIKRIERQNNRMKDLVQQLLILSKLDMDKCEENDEVIRADEVVEFLCREIEEDMDEEDIFDLKLSPVEVRANMTYLVILINNLLNNAVKYGRSKEKIEAELFARDDMMFFSVRDHGLGMTEETKKRMYESFYRGDASRSSDGYGLGLTLARQIALHYNGSLTMENPTDGGCKFTAVLNISLINK